MTADAASQEIALEAEGLTRHFRGVRALDGVDFTVRRGRTVALIGPNGSGKSTCLNLLSGHDRPTAGTARLFGQPLAAKAPWRVAKLGIRRTFQLLRIFKGLSVMDNVKLGAENAMAPGAAGNASVDLWPDSSVHERTVEALRFVGLEDKQAIMAGHLPGGQARLLELARAIAGRPAVLLLDEPGAGLNNAESEFLASRLSVLREQGMTTLLVEHDMSLVMNLADWVVAITEGRLLASGEPAAVQDDARVQEAYLGAAHADQRLKALKDELRGV